ncbi:methyltransferase domain-containing protein [Atopomonas sediminilitoris]|uniref:methyltransferase domain-containing protein n=1 Tax=Atopomonas sediminilitoris TaxID=2919919 RepID=UPI001F4EF4A2|nr:methyltransferase domain-containing protein [Atopomonas sediminilitoris]MCJ8170626.1 methyltransferase domain-containing protein [Atopomonas sediminilitoris]
MSADQHFDELSSRFARKIYGSTKGAIRLSVLQRDLTEALPSGPLKVLDIGAGQGHMALWLAQQGHQVTVTEPSTPMLSEAQQAFSAAGCSARFINAAWQQLDDHLADEQFDVVLCHAVLEWLAEPFLSLPALKARLNPAGLLSLAFYNQDALHYHNLLKRNFRKVSSARWAGDKGGLTPQHPLDPRQLEAALHDTGLAIQQRSGIRVFHDYMPREFRQLASADSLVEQELLHSRHPAFMGLGRYLHWLCRAQ